MSIPFQTPSPALARDVAPRRQVIGYLAGPVPQGCPAGAVSCRTGSRSRCRRRRGAVLVPPSATGYDNGQQRRSPGRRPRSHAGQRGYGGVRPVTRSSQESVVTESEVLFGCHSGLLAHNAEYECRLDWQTVLRKAVHINQFCDQDSAREARQRAEPAFFPTAAEAV